MKTKAKLSLYILFGGLIFNVFLQTIQNLVFKGRQLTIFIIVESATSVLLITAVNLIFVLCIIGIVKVIRKKWPSFLVPSIVVTVITFFIIFLATVDLHRENKGYYGKTNDFKLSLVGTAKAGENQVLSQIEYQLPYVSKKQIKAGKIVEQKVEAQTFLGEPYKYKILRLNTKNPILTKSIGSEIVEEKQLLILNKTNQGNIYLADVSQVGNVFLISIFPKQKTVAVSMQYWLSHKDVIVLWQGFGLYE